MKTLAAALFLALLWQAAIAAENLVVPSDVYELIKARGCDQVADFFQRPAAEEPPYALVNEDWGKRQLAVWCTRDAGKPEEERDYTLVVIIDDKSNPLAKCPDEIRGIRHIGGLRFEQLSQPIGSYHFVDTGKKLPGAGLLKSRGIRSMYDGVGEYYACVDGRWAVHAVH